MNIGMPSGFISFNTMGHRILVHMHQHGPATVITLTEDLRYFARQPLQAISANLQRLHAAGFIHKIGKVRHSSGTRYCTLYSLKTSLKHVVYAQKKTGTERSREYRARKALKVSNIFDFRGTIQL
jgi:hypothetical protein